MIAALTLSPGCDHSSARRQKLASPYPLDRVEAAVQLAEAGDTGAVDRLIELLDDRDRGVRMYTILALERLCGRTYGYRYYDPEPVRAAAIARWRAARQRGEVTVQAPAQQRERQEAAAVKAPAGSETRSP
jgi:hypothetical protein